MCQTQAKMKILENDFAYKPKQNARKELCRSVMTHCFLDDILF